MRFLCLFILVFMWNLPFAQAKDNDCYDSEDIDIAFRACTKIIESIRENYKGNLAYDLSLAYSNRAFIYAHKKSYALALADFDEAIKITPSYHPNYLYRGRTYELMKDYDKALASYDEALSWKSQYEPAIKARQKLVDFLNKRKQAESSSKGLVDRVIDYFSSPEEAEKQTKQKPQDEMALKQQPIKKKTQVANVQPKPKVIKRTGKRIALVIGNDRYANLPQHYQLKKARNDARSTGKTFKKLGFNVMQGFDLKRREMNVQLSKLANKIELGDEVMFFFAGHGVRIDGRNYLLPSDVPDIEGANEELLKSESLNVDAISDMFRKRGARLSLLVLDACRNNPYKGNRTRSIGGTRGLAPMDPPEGTLVLFSAGAGQEALDRLDDNDRDPNSVFTRIFLPMVAQEGLELSRLSRLVKAKVRDLAKTVGHKQTPAVYNEVIGDVYLADQ